MIILDTNVISELQKPAPSENVIAWLDAQDPSNLYLTSVTVGELMFGVFSMRRGAKFESLSNAVSALVEEDFKGRIIPYDANAAYYFGMRVGSARRKGQTIGLADGQIASIAIANDLAPVATRDSKPFEMLNVDVIDPWRYPNGVA